MKKLAAIFLSLVLLAVCATASAAVKIPTTIEETGISMDFTAPEIDMSGAEFLEVSNVKVETTEDGYVVTGEFSVAPEWASIFSEAGDGYVSLYWDEDLKAFVSDELLTDDDLIISFDGGERDDEGEPIISWYTQLYMDTLELQYQHYGDEKASYDKSGEGDLSYSDLATDTYVSVNPETGYYSYYDGKINHYKNEYGTFYSDIENGIDLSIYEDYSYYTASTGENESLYVEFMPNGKLSYYGFNTFGADGSNYYYSEGAWFEYDAATETSTKLDGQPAGVDLSDMPDLLAAPVASAKPEHIWFGKNTLGLAAVSMKDLGISSDWHNVAPVDLTTDGTTVFTLVGADAWILGNAYVTVAEGNVTVTYDILDGHGYMKSEKMNWFLTKADLTEENLKADSNYAFGEPVSIADDLDGAETAILFIDSKITFRQPYFDAYTYSTRYYRNRENWKEYREGLIEMIGE